MQYRNLGHLQQPEDLQLWLVNCGYYKDVDRPLHTCRSARSRWDHHMILVRRGTFHVLIQDERICVGEGGMVYIPPGALQDYTYTPGDGTAYYWLHFDGSHAAALIGQMGLTWGVYRPSRFSELYDLLEQLLASPSYHPESYYTGLNGYLHIFLSALSRNLAIPADSGNKLMEIIQAVQTHPESALSNADYAAQCGISEYHFTRLFREQTGTTPRQYRNRSLMEKAQQLLTDTDMNVSEVARAVHIQDPLYFSRLFKQHFGCSPREYRTQK